MAAEEIAESADDAAGAAPGKARPGESSPAPASTDEERPQSYTSRLLDAKRRAQKKAETDEDEDS